MKPGRAFAGERIVEAVIAALTLLLVARVLGVSVTFWTAAISLLGGCVIVLVIRASLKLGARIGK